MGSTVKAPFMRNPYNYDVNEASDLSGLLCEDLSLTVQAEAEDADINVIVKRFGVTGMLPQNVKIPMAGEFLDIGDYHTALNRVMAADDAFMQMPADVRARFNHDPGELIRFCENPANREEAIKLGIVNAPAASPAGADLNAPSAPPSPSAGT